MTQTAYPILQRTRYIAPAILAVLLLAPAAARAQEEADEAVYELSPFEVRVEDDRGYRATTTTSGTALDTLIRDLPMGLEVITAEFIEDQQALDFREAIQYSAGIFFETHRDTTAATQDFEVRDRSPSGAINIANPFANAISIRGYSVPNQQRLGFRIGAIVPAYGVVLGGSTDTANTQRQEVVRGPQSLLYGINVLSGIVNIIPRRPSDELRTRISTTLGSHQLKRFALDHSGPVLPGTLNYRVLGTYTEQGHWEDFRDSRRNYYVGQLDWFIGPRMRLFLEGQYSESVAYGGGPKFFVDAGGDNFEFRNLYDQRYTYGRDFFDDRTIDNPAVDGVRHQLPDGSDIEVELGMSELIRKPGETYQFPDLGEAFRISGPDVRREEEEYNFLALATMSPFENVNIELGAYYTKTEIWERGVHMGVFTDTSSTVRPASLHEPPGAAWARNPEADVEDVIGFGPGELFIAEHPARDRVGSVVADRKFAHYSWFERPTSSESLQLRGRVAYTFETGWLFGGAATHTAMLGATNIRDKVSLVTGTVPSLDYVYAGEDLANIPENRHAEDPVAFRRIFDYEPLRYTGQTPAIIGRLSTANLPGLSGATTSVRRSGWIDADLSYRGYYGVYQGKMFEDRLHLVGGVRRDLYQVRESEHLRVMDRGPDTDFWQGSGDVRRTPVLIGYADEPYEWRPELPDALNAAVEADVARLREIRPDGTVEYNFARPQSFDTGTFGLSYRLSEAWSLYYLRSEGVFPNTGQRDGANRPIEAEQTVNNEIGIKFDLLDDRISGTISAFRIERENAVWNWQHAPRPSVWRGGPEHAGPGTGDGIGPFFPELVAAGELPIIYGVADEYVVEAFQYAGLLSQNPTPGELRSFRRDGTFIPYGVVDGGDWTLQTAAGYTGFQVPDPTRELPVVQFAMIDYLKMGELDERFASGELHYWEVYPHTPATDAPIIEPGSTVRVGFGGKIVGPDEPGVDMPFANPLRLAAELAVRDETQLGYPIYWTYQIGNRGGHSASTARGANVLYEEKGVGIDGQFLVRPTENYSIVFSFSRQKREVTGSGFTLAPGARIDIDGHELRDGPNNGLWTTEYDTWVWMIGPENFEDPRDPSSLKQGAIQGLDLSFVPRTSLRLWNKYEFRDTFLDGMEVGGGVRYNGPVATAVEVGGERMARNMFLPPSVPERYVFDAFVAYRSMWRDRVAWRVAFNVNNLFNHRISIATRQFEHPDTGEDVHRRTRVFHAPRTYRLSLSLDF